MLEERRERQIMMFNYCIIVKAIIQHTNRHQHVPPPCNMKEGMILWNELPLYLEYCLVSNVRWMYQCQSFEKTVVSDNVWKDNNSPQLPTTCRSCALTQRFEIIRCLRHRITIQPNHNPTKRLIRHANIEVHTWCDRCAWCHWTPRARLRAAAVEQSDSSISESAGYTKH